ncbi:MAG: IclR family transcriptional regulator [Hyphomicrobiales bacterium]|nr:MAG: IclR family transcriptional regulator [Hyphomicrobiales bacterium]
MTKRDTAGSLDDGQVASAGSSVGEEKARRHVQSVNIGWNLLKVLTDSSAPMSLKQLSQGSGLSPSQAHLYLTSLQMVGVVKQDGDTGRYDLGPYALELGLAALRRIDILTIARPIMSDLRDATKEAVFLTVWGNRGPALIYRLDGTAASSRTLRVGYVLSLSTSATGRVWAAHMPESETHTVLQQEWEADPSAQMSDEAWRTALAECRREGMSGRVSDEGFGVLCAPVFDHEDTIRAAISVTGPQNRVDLSPQGDLASALRSATQQFSHQLGRPDPDI